MTTPSKKYRRFQGARAHGMRQTRWWPWVLVLGLLWSMARLDAWAQAAPARPLILGADADPATFTNRWAALVFVEAFRRLNVPIQIINYPLARRTLLVDAGEIDVDGGRVYAYGEAHPQLIRVTEPWVEFNFTLYTANAAVRLQTLEELRATAWLVEYRRGILYCEKTLKALLPAERLSDISSEEQGVSKLLAGRTDLYCDLDYVVREVLNAPKFKDATRVQKVLSFGSVPIYFYLQPRHAELAPRLSVIIKKMKEERLIELYQNQVAQEMGLSR
ncbi:MAG: hypothetical protein V4858_01870 [Pseudomonadota bacterium]